MFRTDKKKELEWELKILELEHQHRLEIETQKQRLITQKLEWEKACQEEWKEAEHDWHQGLANNRIEVEKLEVEIRYRKVLCKKLDVLIEKREEDVDNLLVEKNSRINYLEKQLAEFIKKEHKTEILSVMDGRKNCSSKNK